MGCSPGKDSHMLIVFDSAEFKADLKVFERLKLNTKDSHNLYQVFDKLLSDDMRTVSQEKLRDYTGLPSTAFVKEILSILNPSQSEDLNFRGFVVCLWNYCTLTRDNMGTSAWRSFLVIRRLITLILTPSSPFSCRFILV